MEIQWEWNEMLGILHIWTKFSRFLYNLLTFQHIGVEKFASIKLLQGFSKNVKKDKFILQIIIRILILHISQRCAHI